MRITMVGTGYVGLVTGTCFASTGNEVTCLDVDEAKIDMLRQGGSPIYEPGLDELIRRNAKAGRLNFTTDKRSAYASAEIIFICVGTPSDCEGRADLQYVLAAARDVGDAIEQGHADASEDDEAKIIIVKSTVPVGTNARVKSEIQQRTGKPFHMASNPEFLKEGAAISDFMKPDRVVIGCDDKRTGDRLRDLYEPFVRQGNPIFIMDIASAEMVKYAANAMLATKISFINEVANLCEAYGADIDEVRRGMCSDSRIGNKFLYPGLGYGGSCFPKDVLACIAMGEQSGAPAALLHAVHQVNQRQRDTFMAKIDRHFASDSATRPDGQSDAQANGQRDGQANGQANGQASGASLIGKTVAVWGIAFKPGTDDVREAPSVTLMQHLLDRGATVVAHDPVAHETCRQLLGDRVRYADDAYAALDGADALVLCTDWDDFKFPDFDEMRVRMSQPVIFDGRNLYRTELMHEHGFIYYSVGRDPIYPEPSNLTPGSAPGSARGNIARNTAGSAESGAASGI